jgi:hypothetical protein
MTGRLVREGLVAQAVQQAGSDDFGEPTWEEGLDRLLDSLSAEAELNDLGVEIAADDVVNALANRLSINEWRASHPEVAAAPVDRPIIIVGQPRTGTTILFDLLEVDRPCPPPEPATYRSDPRIAEVQATIDMADLVIPGFLDFHPLGATLGQECVRMTAGDFRSMIFSTVFDVPTYNSWLLHEADMAPAYRWHRRYLQHLQSRTDGRWLLKSPAHLWHLDALAGEYPDAVVVQTHRDPLRVIASVSALADHLRRMASSRTSVARAAAQYSEDIVLGLQRGMDARDRGVLVPDRWVDIQYGEFLADPFGTIRRLYTRLGRDLDPSVEQAMRRFLAAHPGDGGGSRYSWADTGLDATHWRERVAPYQQRYGVPDEPVE